MEHPEFKTLTLRDRKSPNRLT